MTEVQLLTGAAAEGADSSSDFAGTLSPRRYRIDPRLEEAATKIVTRAFQGGWGADIELARAFAGLHPQISEAFSTSDFTLAAFALVDKEMLAKYDEFPSVWRQYTNVTTTNDFRPKRLDDRWRLTVGFEKVPELTEYPQEDNRGHAEYYISVAKWGRRFAISWESWINNTAIQELEDLPTVLATQANETETINAITNLILADRTGVNTGFFKSANANAPTALPLTYDNLLAVLNAMAAKASTVTGRQIASPPLTVVIPRALEYTAEYIKGIREIRTTSGAVEVLTTNVLANVDFVVEPMLDYWNTHAKKATTWFVLPKPASSTRPALWAAYLRGHESPDLRVKADTGNRVGGGAISPLEGSFEIDDIQYRGRMIVGNQVGDPTFTYVSLGS